MISKEEKDRLKAIIADTVTLLCKNGLNAKFKREFTVEGLIGITLDKDDLMLVSIKEIVENPAPPPPSSSSESGDSSGDDENKVGASGRKRKRKRKKNRTLDGETPAKTSKVGDDDENDSDLPQSEARTDDMDTPSATPAKRNLFSQNTTGGASNLDSSNMESNDSYYTLHDIKQDHSDDDLIEIIKEEPGLISPGNQPHIVSIQSIPSASNMPPQQQVLGTMSQQPLPSMNPNMPSPSGQINPAQLPPGLQMAPGQYEDLMQQVELIPGSGVYIKKATYNQLQFIDKGSKLVRKLVREIFPDVHLLASSSCMGKGETSAGLDRHKVEVIKEFAWKKCGFSTTETLYEVRSVCRYVKSRLQLKGLWLPQENENKSRNQKQLSSGVAREVATFHGNDFSQKYGQEITSKNIAIQNEEDELQSKNTLNAECSNFIEKQSSDIPIPDCVDMCDINE